MSNVLNVVVVAVVLVAAGIAAILLARTMIAAQNINQKAAVIAQTGRGIGTATDSVVQLTRTNEVAASIRDSVKPVEAKLVQVVDLAKEVDALAGSILGSAGTINTTAGTINNSAQTINTAAGTILTTAGTINTRAVAINNTAKEINATAGVINTTAGNINAEVAGILDVAKRINSDVKSINRILDTTIGLAQGIKSDTGNILNQARIANRNAACIENKVKVQGVLGNPTAEC